MRRGTLVLVVGPSGVGKDSVIDAAREALAGDPSVVFVRRTITRPSDAGGENHEAVDEAGFDARERAGAFVLTWRAHGLRYGIPAGIAADLAAGRIVVANASRAVIEEARAKFAPARVPVHVVVVTAPPGVIAERLRRRGRESDAEITERLARAEAYTVYGKGVTTLDNSGALAESRDRFVSLLKGLAEGAS